MLLFHIIAAFLSIAFTFNTYLSPSSMKVKVSWMFVVATLGSGTLLTVVNPGYLLQACLSGSIYLAVVSYGIILTSRKLTNQKI
jgi:hypothetical protein